MIILIILAVIFIISLTVKKYVRYYSDIDVIAAISSIFFGFLLLISLIILPIKRMQIRSDIRAFNAVQTTIQNARNNNIAKIESGAFQLKIAEKNEWLASINYYNSTVFSLWIPDEITKLNPIE